MYVHTHTEIPKIKVCCFVVVFFFAKLFSSCCFCLCTDIHDVVFCLCTDIYIYIHVCMYTHTQKFLRSKSVVLLLFFSLVSCFLAVVFAYVLIYMM